MVRSHKQSGTTHTQKVNMFSIYDKMEKYSNGNVFQMEHKPYDYPKIKRIGKGKSHV